MPGLIPSELRLHYDYLDDVMGYGLRGGPRKSAKHQEFEIWCDPDCIYDSDIEDDISDTASEANVSITGATTSSQILRPISPIFTSYPETPSHRRLADFYSSRCPNNPNLYWCPISRAYHGHASITATNILPMSLGGYATGVIFDCLVPVAEGGARILNSLQNGLILHKALARAFHRFDIVIIPRIGSRNSISSPNQTVELQVSVIKPWLWNEPINGIADYGTYGSLDGRVLEFFDDDNCPDLRFLFFHFLCGVLFYIPPYLAIARLLLWQPHGEHWVRKSIALEMATGQMRMVLGEMGTGLFDEEVARTRLGDGDESIIEARLLAVELVRKLTEGNGNDGDDDDEEEEEEDEMEEVEPEMEWEDVENDWLEDEDQQEEEYTFSPLLI